MFNLNPVEIESNWTELSINIGLVKNSLHKSMGEYVSFS